MSNLFGNLPRRKIPRSRKNLSFDLKTTCNVGTLYPLACIDVLPDDIFSTLCKNVSRISSTFIKPIMDNLVFEIHAFYCPLTLGYDDAYKIFANPNPNAYVQNERLNVPFYSDIVQNGQNLSTITVELNTVNERLGCPIGTYDSRIDCIEPRLFACIWDEYFRNENITNPMFIQKGAPTLSEIPNNLDWSNTNYNGKLPKVSKMRDYFTSCIPKPQKGENVTVPVKFAESVTLPVNLTDGIGFLSYIGDPDELGFFNVDIGQDGRYTTINTVDGTNYPVPSLGYWTYADGSLSAQLSEARASIGVEDIRLATALQRMLEIDATYGSHYHDYLIGHFDTFIRDDVVRRPEYLGGGLIPINIQQVNQTSAGSESSPLANIAGTSLTNGFFKFNRKFKQHGKLFIVGFIRQLHTYQQGMPRRRMRRSREDFFDPLLSHLGEQPVYQSEIYTGSTTDLQGQVFGYNVAYADYQFLPSQVTGQMRSGITNSLDVWHLADYYQNAPALVDGFIQENTANIDRVVSVESNVQDNFLCEFYFDIKVTRKMPYSTRPLDYGV